MARGSAAVVLFLAGCDCAGPRSHPAPDPIESTDGTDEVVDVCEERPGTTGCPCDRGDPPDKCYEGPAEAIGNGPCARGLRRCTSEGWSECFGQVLPEDELCNGIDDDCDGTVDDACGPCDGPCEYKIDDGMGEAREPRLFVDGAGVATVAWSRDGAVFARRDDDGTWGDVEYVGQGREHAVSGSPSGDVFVVWIREEFYLPDADVWERRHSSTGWAGPMQVARIVGDETEPAIAVDGVGNARGVWLDSARWLWSGGYAPGGAWQNGVIESGIASVRAAAVASADSGESIVVWSTVDGVYAWEPGLADETVATEHAGGVGTIDVGMDASANAVAVWVDLASGAFDLWAATRPAGGAWSEPEWISRVEGDAQTAFVVAADGTAFLVWSSEGQVATAVRAPEGGWSVQERLDVGERIAGVDVVADESGATAVWARADGAASRVWASRWRGAWGDLVQVSSKDRWDAERPEVGAAPGDEAVVVWEQRIGEAHGIHAMRILP